MTKTHKPGNRIFSAVSISLSAYWQVRKSLLVCCYLAIVFCVTLPFAGIYMPRMVINLIQQQSDVSHFLFTVGGLALIMVALGYGKSFTDSIVDNCTGTTGIFSFMLKTLSKEINMDYEQLEHPGFKTVMDKSQKAVQSNHTLAMNIPRTLVQLFSNTIGFVLYKEFDENGVQISGGEAQKIALARALYKDDGFVMTSLYSITESLCNAAAMILFLLIPPAFMLRFGTLRLSIMRMNRK